MFGENIFKIKEHYLLKKWASRFACIFDVVFFHKPSFIVNLSQVLLVKPHDNA